jgi:hypothetical protein
MNGVAMEATLERAILELMTCRDVENARNDIYSAAERMRILPLLEMAAIQVSDRADVFQLTDAEFEALLLKFRPLLGRTILQRQIRQHNARL